MLIWLCLVGVPPPCSTTMIIAFRRIFEMRIVIVHLQRSLELFEYNPNNTFTLDVRLTKTLPSVELGKLIAELLSEGRENPRLYIELRAHR